MSQSTEPSAPANNSITDLGERDDIPIEPYGWSWPAVAAPAIAIDPGLPRDDIVSALQAEQERAMAYILRLNYRLNWEVKVNKLPDDVLVIIFSALVEECVRNGEYYRWLHAVTTCRRWMHLALHSPTLWTKIDAAKLDCAYAFARRSQNLPLDVKFRSPNPEVEHHPMMKPLANFLNLVGDRIRKLDLAVTRYNLDDLEPSITTTFPKLECFVLDRIFTDEAHILTEEGGVILLDQLVPYHPLHTISLNNVAMPWASSCFSNLVVLRVSYDYAQPITVDGIHPSFSRFMEILALSPRLHDLIIENINPFLATQTAAQTVELLSLRKLTLQGDSLSVKLLLSHIITPPTASISLIYDMNDLEDVVLPPNALAGLKILSTITKANMAFPVNSATKKPTITGYSPSGETFQLCILLLGTPLLYFDLGTLGSMLGNTLNELTLRVPFHPVRHSRWHMGLRGLPRLSRLRIIDDCVKLEFKRTADFLQAFATSPDGSDAAFLPNLTHLELVGFMISHRFNGLLLHGLKARAELGAPKLKVLKIESPEWADDVTEDDPYSWPNLEDYVYEFIVPDYYPRTIRQDGEY
ncbi:hypothetical protein K474DRAFT_1775100 [Panus rudis PR-1116 ss-1]|nr:hypothetical protein K474DRAFT_1775100 [Panus rudis PR-1116 ss-1]